MKKFFKKELRKPFAIILFIFICLFVCIKLLGPIPLFVNQFATNKTALFAVQGTGIATELPNSAKLSFSVTKTALSVSDAQNQTNTTINQIIQSITSQGIAAKDMSTTNYSVFPQYNVDANGKQTPNGFSVTEDIEVKISPIDKTSKILDLATANGATQIGGIAFTFDNSTKTKLEAKAREEAIKNAKQKAQDLANATGIHLRRIVDITENTPQVSPRPFTATSVNSGASQELPQLPSGENSITSSVTLSYETD